MDKGNRLMEIAKKKKLTKKDIAFLKTCFKKNHWKVKYAFYNKNSPKNRYVAFIIDSLPNSPRRSGVENNWEIICERELTNFEYEEQIQNWGCNNRRFNVYYYDCIERLQRDDKKYHFETPEKYVKEAKKRGYSMDLQTIMEFEFESA